MKISALEIDGFGVWRDLKLKNLGEPVVVFYGPNEAGKTTLMQFVRAILYGFSAERRARYLPPVDGGRAGGIMQVLQGERSLTISRHGDDDSLGTLKAIDTTAATPYSVSLVSLLGDVDEGVFNHVFALGLRDMQELGTLSDTDAAHLLYDLTLGLDRVSLADVLRELGTSRNRLLSEDDRPSVIAQLLSQRTRLRGEIEELQQLTPRYLELIETRRRIDREIQDAQTDHDHAARRVQIVELARSLANPWKSRARVVQQLTALGAVHELPAGALPRLDEFNLKIAEHREQIAVRKKQAQKLREEAAAIAVHEKLCQVGPRLEALAEQLPWLTALESQLGQLETEIAELEGERRAGDHRFGGKGKDPARTIQQLESLAHGVSEARRIAKAAKEDATKQPQSSPQRIAAAPSEKQIPARLQALSAKIADDGLDASLDKAGKLVTNLRRRMQIEDRLGPMQREQRELDNEARQWLDRQVMPMWQSVGLGTLFTIGCSLMLLTVAGLMLPESMTGSLGLPVGLVGLSLAAVGGLTRYSVEQFSVEQLDSVNRQLDVLRRQLSDVTKERDQLDAAIPKGGGTFVTRLQAAEAELAQLEELVPYEAQRSAQEAQRSAVRETADIQRTSREEALQNWQKARRRWRQALVEAGMPEDLTPKALREYRRHDQQKSQLELRLEHKRQQLLDRRREQQSLMSRIVQIAGEISAKTPSGGPVTQLEEMLTQLQEHQARAKRRDGLRSQVAELRRESQPILEALRKLSGSRRALLTKCGASTEAEVRRLADVQAEAQRLERERNTLETEIAAALLGRCTEAEVAAHLDSSDDLERSAQHLTTQLTNAKGRLNRLFEERGEMNQQLKTLADDRRLADKQIELGSVQQRLNEALARWRVLAACDVVLDRVRAVYERDHQPQTLREASIYLQQLTSGRYTRVWTPLGEHVLRVDDAEGTPLPVEVLSRGTREQLFLSLRLALVTAYAARGVRLPLVLDDVLVNFDSGRARAAIEVLKKFAAAGHQIFMFTCHEHVADMFREVDTAVRLLPENSRPRARMLKSVVAPVIDAIPDPIPESPVEVTYVEPVTISKVILAPPVMIENTTVMAAPIELPPFVPAAFSPVVVEPAPIPVATVEPAPKPAPIPRTRSSAPRKPRPQPQPQTTVRRRVERSDWDAEEFAGELQDRVRVIEEPVEVEARRDVDDMEAA